ncbi:MAG: outer membrane beta-barrel family protein [Duncaniella sp.]|nr:outer membrane beta-barrel family protein [Duncaniella sp.]
MKHLTILILSLISLLPVVSARTIQGVVLSASDSTAVVGAECRLMTDGKLITGTTVGESGNFSVEISDKSVLELNVYMAGFSSTDIIIESGSKNLNLGTIYLDKGVFLDGVTVTGNSVTYSKGRMIIYPSDAVVKASATTISLFQKLPLAGLQANPITRSISVDGGSPVILINGVPSSIDDVNALQSKDIEKIEFSRFTPARYADSGNSGFINITLKKRNDGGQIYAWGRSAVTTAFVDANIRASYHQGASQISLQYLPSWRNYQQVYDNTIESYIGEDFRVNLEEHDRNPFNYHYHQLKLKYDYSPSVKTLFSATFSATPTCNKSRSIAYTIDSELGVYEHNNLTTSKDFTPSLDLFWRQDFNEKNTLEVEVVGTLSSSDYRRDNNYIFSDQSDDSYIMNVDSRRRSLISEVSYIHTFSEKTSLSAGLQNTVSHSTNRYLTSDDKPVLTENNNYAYVRLGQRVGKCYIALSTGAKMFWIKNDLNKRNFIRNLSSAQLSWNISNSWSLQGSFRYSPSIPSLTALTDYPQQTTPYLISNGNPELKVADNFLYIIGVDYTYKKFTASFQSAYSDVDNSVISDVSYLGNGLFLSQSVNAKYRRAFQNDLTLSLSDIHGFGANLYMSLTHYQSAGVNWSHKLTSFDGSITLWWNKGPYTISYWRKLPGKYLSGNYVGKDENGDALQLEWQPNKHWTIGASWMYMFDRKGTRYPAWDYSAVNPSYRERYIKDNGNMVVISVSYSADFGSIFRTARRNLNNTDNGSSLLKL